jgi:methylmalonyl-CoA mutase C-terminal domain/subunit
MEVIYTGLRQTPEMITEAALQEDVQVVGLSILSGAHMTLVPKVLKLLDEQGLSDVKLFLGGIIPDEDKQKLIKLGVDGMYGPGTSTQLIIEDIRKACQ